MKILYVTCRVPFGNGTFQTHDTYIVADKVIAITPSPDGCVITCVDGEAFDTANDPLAIVGGMETE